MTLEEIKKEFERRFVPKIIRGKTFTYDWDKEDLENWQWIESQIESACKKQREICADYFDKQTENMTFEDIIYEIERKTLILNAPSPTKQTNN